MNILISAGGTRGDVQPMLALALALRGRGHRVRLCAPPNFGPWIAEHQLSFRPLGRDVQAFLADTGLDIGRALGTLQTDIRDEFVVLGEEAASADMILGASVTSAGVSLGAKLGIPYLYFVYSPSLLPSAHHPSPTCPWLRLPRWANRLSWWGVRKVWNRLFRRVLDEERARLGLGPIRDTWDYVQDAPIIVACDPALATPPPDAPPRVRQPGPLLLSEAGGLPEHLERFLAAGPPPVYVGFGSMPDRTPAATTTLVLEAVRALGARAVIARGWSDLGGSAEARDDICLVDTVPHGALFPRVAAVVHHGGVGTTTSAARAGVPQLVVPHILDQFFWGDRIATLGLGPRPIPRRKLTPRRLAAALTDCLAQERHRERARSVAVQMTDGGLQATVALVEGGAVPLG